MVDVNVLTERIQAFIKKGWVMHIADTYVMWVSPVNPDLFIKVSVHEVPLTFVA